MRDKAVSAGHRRLSSHPAGGFGAVGGYDATHLPVSYSDINNSLKQRARGPGRLDSDGSLYHYESKARGPDHLDVGKAARDTGAPRILETRWPGMTSVEPGLNLLWRHASHPHRNRGPSPRDAPCREPARVLITWLADASQWGDGHGRAQHV